jgi:2-polyprenyl-3-methyl-5-hydroxy-6-metoxy-1,4-benzoquinol methylase
MLQQDYVRGGTQKSAYTEHEVLYWPCPLCGSDEENLIKTERQVLGIVSCRNCSLIRVNPRLKNPDEVYRGKSAIYSEEFRLVREGKAPHHRDPNYLRDLELIEEYKPHGNFLDIGTNTGSFLRLARGRSWKLTGVEPSPQLGQLARDWWGLDIVEGFIETVNLPSHHFDIVTMTDVFEHIVNPKEVLAAVKQVLKPDGLLFIKVPNGRFNILKHWGRRALGKKETDDFDAYEHVLHYTDKTLKAMLRASGFDPFRITVEPPVQLPVWHKHVGHYYHHRSPFLLDWKTYSGRNLLYAMSLGEFALTRRVGYCAPNIGCFARPANH